VVQKACAAGGDVGSHEVARPPRPPVETTPGFVRSRELGELLISSDVKLIDQKKTRISVLEMILKPICTPSRHMQRQSSRRKIDEPILHALPLKCHGHLGMKCKSELERMICQVLSSTHILGPRLS